MSCSVAIISKENSPIYILTCNVDKEIELQYKIHSALDIIDEKFNISTNKNHDIRELYFGLLYATETFKIYGYQSNTKIKFIIVVDSQNSALRENEIRTMFRAIHSAYVDCTSNPFLTPNEPILSKNFDRNIKSIVSRTV
ncbi:unnamed protein product [Diamesa serratosioi]